MTIKVNDWAVHPRHGVGRITKLEVRLFPAGRKRLYFTFEIPTGTVWVPAEGSAGGLRRLTSRADLNQYRRVLMSRPAPLARDYRKRQTALQERQSDNSFDARCRLVRDLSALGWHKELNQTDSAMLRSARDALCTEWAAVDGASLAEATQEVMTLLADGKKSHSR